MSIFINKRTIALTFSLIVFTVLVGRAEGPVVSGYIDTTYNYNFNNPKNDTNTLFSYNSKANNIALNTAHLGFMGTLGDAMYNIEIDAGQDALVNTAGASAGSPDDFDIQEAYMAYTCPITHIGIKAGKFVTFMGIEVIESKDDPTISRGYLYGLEPFTHVGGLLTYVIGKFDFAAGVVNGFDVMTDNNDEKTLAGKITGNFGDPLMVTLSAYHGSEQANVADDPTTVGIDETDSNDNNDRTTVDLTGVTKIIPKVALWFQYLHGEEEAVFDMDGDGTPESSACWNGFGIQPIVTITSKFSIGARYEYLDDNKGVKTGMLDTIVQNYTIAPAYKLTDNMTVRAELRLDNSNGDNELFQDDKGVSKSNQTTGALQFLLTF